MEVRDDGLDVLGAILRELAAQRVEAAPARRSD
jgi:hypothetical protein